MAYIGSGLGGQLGLSQETTVWNGSSTPQSPDHWYRFESENLAGKRKVVQAQEIGGGNLYDRGVNRFVTQLWADGDINLNFPNKGAGLLIKHWLGSPVVRPTLVSAGVYQSVHTPGSTNGMSLCIQKGVPPTNGAAPEPYTYPGAKITDWELSCAMSDIVKLKCTFDAMSELTAATTPASPALATPTYAASAPFAFTQGTLKQGGTPNTVTTAAPTTPVQAATSTATTGGTLAAATYFYVITAINATGETIASNEKSQITTGATSTVTLGWASVTGATGYNIYRSTTTGTEVFLATVGAVTSYIDTGSATPGTATPPVTATAVATTVTTVSGGTAMARVRAVKVGGKNGLKTDNFYLGSGTTKGEQNINAYRGLTGSVDIEFYNRALYDQYRAGTSTSLELTFTGANIPSTSTPFSIDIVLPQVFLEDGISPTIQGPDIVMMTVPFTVTFDDTDPTIQVTYTTSDSVL